MNTIKLRNLPIGTKIADAGHPETVFLVAQKPGTPGYSGIVIVADHIIKQGCFDAREPKNPDRSRASWGNNHYPTSNAHQWLNADGEDWYTPAHEYDTPPTAENIYDGDNPYANRPGFLTPFSATFKAALREARITTAKGGDSETIEAKVWLMSASETGFDKDGREGATFPLFEDFRMKVASPTPEAVADADYTPDGFDPDEGWYWWLRSPYSAYSYYVRLVSTDGSEDYNSAYYGSYGLRPALLLSSDISVSDEPDERGAYLVG